MHFWTNLTQGIIQIIADTDHYCYKFKKFNNAIKFKTIQTKLYLIDQSICTQFHFPFLVFWFLEGFSFLMKAFLPDCDCRHSLQYHLLASDFYSMHSIWNHSV